MKLTPDTREMLNERQLLRKSTACSRCNYTPLLTDDCPGCTMCACGNTILKCTCLERL